MNRRQRALKVFTWKSDVVCVKHADGTEVYYYYAYRPLHQRLFLKLKNKIRQINTFIQSLKPKDFVDPRATRPPFTIVPIDKHLKSKGN